MNRRWLRALASLLALILTLAPALGEEAGYEDYEDDYEVVVLDPQEEIEFETSIDGYMLEERERVAQMRSLLLVGIDARPGEETGRADTIMIVTLDPDSNTIKLTSIMRDLYVEIPGRKNNRINATYVFGGPELLMETIELNFGIHVENYIAVNFSMLGRLIDAIGGLTLTVENDYYKDRINAVIKQDNKVLRIDVNDGLLTQAGEQRMTGKQAQAYARYRYGTPDGDFGRTARQREVVTLIFEDLAERTAIELINLIVSNSSNIYTNLTVMDLAAFAPVLISMKGAEISELRLPIDGGYTSASVAGMSVLKPDRQRNTEAALKFLEE